jgi:hypothetical protein
MSNQDQNNPHIKKIPVMSTAENKDVACALPAFL